MLFAGFGRPARPGAVTCCSPSATGLFVLGAFQRSSMGPEPAKPSWVQNCSFTPCLTPGTRLFIPQQHIPLRDALKNTRKHPQKTQNIDVFLPPASHEPHTHVRQPGTFGVLLGEFGVCLLLGGGMSEMPGWHPLASFFFPVAESSTGWKIRYVCCHALVC